MDISTLIKEQAVIGERINKAFANFKKSPSRRTLTNVQSKLERLDHDWSEFERNDIKLQPLKSDQPTHTYFERDYYDQVNAVHQQYRQALSTALDLLEAESSKPGSDDSHEEESLQQLQRLIRQQTAAISSLQELLDEIARDLDNKSPAFYEVTLNSINQQWHSISERHLEIMAEEDSSSYNVQEYTKIRRLYQVLLVQLQERLPRRQENLAQSHTTTNSSSSIKLPKITLPIFDGSYLKWTEFHDLFEQLVHKKSALSNSEKMFYLKAHLTGEASKLIQHLHVSEENYSSAWKILENRYHNKRLIVSAFLNKLLGQPAITIATSGAIKRLHDVTTECLRGIESLGVPTAEWDPILVHILLQKLDKESHRLYEQELDSPRELQKITGLLTFLEGHFQMWECLIGKPHEQNEQRRHTKQRTSLNSSVTTTTCAVCKNGIHPLFACSKFLQQSPTERLKIVRSLHRCINCLRSGHGTQQCPSRRCKCGASHNSLLHIESTKNPAVQVQNTATSLPAHSSRQTSSYVFLGTAEVQIKDKNNQFITARALLDSGSQINCITERLLKRLKLRPDIERPDADMLEVVGIGNNNITLKHRANVTIHSKTTPYSTTMEAFVLPKIASHQPNQYMDIRKWNLPTTLQLADRNFNKPQEIDLLIGAEFYPDIVGSEKVRLGKNLPTLVHTSLGWIVQGRQGCHKAIQNYCTAGVLQSSPLEEQLQRFWTIEEVPPTAEFSKKKPLTIAEQQCEAFFKTTSKRTAEGRYIVNLPFVHDPSSLGESKQIAVRRFLNLEKKLKKNSQIQQQYINFMREYISLGHMAKINHISFDKPHYFMPHHCVLRPESSTTKLRVVFDGSAKTSTNISLNDILHAGPVLQNDLLSILIRFRTHRYVFISDITKMYRQILVENSDKPFQLIVWRESSSEPLETYQLNTVTYGTKAAPYLAIRCLQDLADAEGTHYPLGAEITKRDFYVDDILTGSDDLDETLEMRNQLINLLKAGGFQLRKWCANTSALLRGIPQEDLETEVSIKTHDEEKVKTLGLTWLPSSDQFMIRTNWQEPAELTKRTILADIARIFDPLGIVSPVIILAKVFMQELWALELDWDSPIPIEIQTKWIGFREELHKLNDLKISRHIIIPSACNLQLHGFSDASNRAFGAAVYMRSTSESGVVSVHLICAKSRVAPKKTTTIPRLELCAAKLLVELMQNVKESLARKIHKVTYWTDSQIVLSWIQTQSPLQTFVANRVTFIQEATDIDQWRFVNSELNPADLVSRGVHPQQLLENGRMWFKGPIFLQKSEEAWPQSARRPLPQPILEERITKTVLTVAESSPHFLDTIDHHNSFKRLQNITAFILRFVSNLKRAPSYRLTDATLSAQELKSSLMLIIKHIQNTEFAEDIKFIAQHKKSSSTSRLTSLCPFLDDKGILRVGGRLEASDLPYEAKHPSVLSSNHIFTKLLMTQIHIDNLHIGPQGLLATTRQRFWPLRGKQLAQTIVHHCIKCFKARPTQITQRMGNLPTERVQPLRPFVNVGVDFFGPTYIHYTLRGKKPTKAYVAVFVCFSTKACHLEMVSDLTSNAFIGALKRFIARRGCPTQIFCDNATNFIGARNQLEELHAMFTSEDSQSQIKGYCAPKGIQWRPIPARSPHFGGLWEAAVKSAKHHMKRTLTQASLTSEELTTVITQIEAILNSRPLTPLTTDPNDLQVLTAGHFLIGEPLTTFADPEAQPIHISSLTRWNLVKSLHQEFWRRWSKEYLQELQNRYKWKNPQQDIKPGTLVLLKDDNLPPLQWNMGRVLRTLPGKDGHTRVVALKTATGETSRAIHKVCPLPIEAQEEINIEVDLHRETQRRTSRTSASTKQNAPAAIQPRTRSRSTNQHGDNKAKRPKRNIRINPVTSLLVGLMLLGTGGCNPTPAAPVDVTQFKSNPGIYFEDLGQAHMISNEWSLIAFFNMSRYWQEYQGLQTCTKRLKGQCITIQSEQICKAIVQHLEQLLQDIANLNEILTTRNGFRARNKRSPFDFVGTVANKLFGILDKQYAEDMDEIIQKIHTNEEHLLNLSRNQTSIIDSTLNLFNKSFHDVSQQFKVLDQHLNQIHNAVSDLKNVISMDENLQLFNSLAIYASLLASTFQRTQLALLEIITDTHQGRINPLLLTPTQLLQELGSIRRNLPPSLILPGNGEQDLPTLYELLRVQARVTTNSIIFRIKLPLLTNQVYQVFKVIPLPTRINGTFFFIQPSTPFLAITPYRDQYFPLSREEINACLIHKDRHYLCKQRHPVFNSHSTENHCEVQFLNHKQQLSPYCILKRTSSSQVWIQLHDPNHWVFAFTEVHTFNIVCGTKILNTQLHGEGLLKLAPNCIIKQPTMTINAHSSFSSKTEISFMPTLNLTASLRQLDDTQRLMTNPSAAGHVNMLIRGEEDLSALVKYNQELKKQQELPYDELKHHDIHQYALSYTTLFICVGAIIIIIIIWPKKGSTITVEAPVFELQDLNVGEDENIHT